jgi:hypothetical protein
MAETLNNVVDEAIDKLQEIKNALLGAAQGGVDVAQEAVDGINAKLDEAIDKLQDAKG